MNKRICKPNGPVIFIDMLSKVNENSLMSVGAQLMKNKTSSPQKMTADTDQLQAECVKI